MAEDRELVDALDRIDTTIGRSAPATRGLPDLKASCETYKMVRPLLEKTLPLIGKIPVYGGKISTAIGFLMKVADVACPAS